MFDFSGPDDRKPAEFLVVDGQKYAVVGYVSCPGAQFNTADFLICAVTERQNCVCRGKASFIRTVHQVNLYVNREKKVLFIKHFESPFFSLFSGQFYC